MENLNYFSEKEKKRLKKFADMRNLFFRPIVIFLDEIGISPNFLSLVSLFLMLGFVYFISTNPYYALAFVAGHILLDGIDGPLARYQGKSGDAGALVDIAVDQMGIVIAVLSMIYFDLIDGFWASLYILSYTLMIVFTIFLNKMGKPIKFLIRSKYLFYLSILIESYFAVQYIDGFLIIFAVYMSLVCVYMYNRIRCLV